MDDEIRIAIVGCGGIARAHLNGYKELKQKSLGGFTIAAVCDLAKERAEDFAKAIEEFQGAAKPRVYLNHEELLKAEDVEMVDICTDHRTHHIIAISSLEAGKDVMVEKPLAITVKAGRKMVETADAHGRTLAVAENYRRTLGNRACKWAIDKGYIGDIQMILQGGVAAWGKGIMAGGTAWRHVKLKTGAGPVLDNGVHDVDLFMHLNGEIVEAYGVTKTFDKVKVRRDGKGQIVEQVENTIEDGGFAILKFANGAVCNWAPAYWGGHGEVSTFGRWIYGSGGCIKGEELIPDTGPRMNVSARFLLEAELKLRNKFFPKGITNTFAIEIHDFLEAMRRKRKPETDGWEGLKAEAVCYAVIESSRLNKTVKVKDVLEGQIEGYQKEINENLGL